MNSTLRAYFDSGVLIKLYVLEKNSSAAAQAIRRSSSIRLNPLQEIEIRNTFYALVGRNVLSVTQAEASEHTLDLDIAAGRLRRIIPDWADAFRKALRLSCLYTSETLARSLDILHVAIAIVEGCGLFVTADRRQEAIALKAGLQTEMVA